MKEYWTHSLSEEGAKYNIKTTKDTFTIEMLQCPSIKILKEAAHIERYPEYCKHCDILYRRIVEDYNFSYNIKYINPELGKCRIVIKKT